MHRTAIVTVVTHNYLHYALALSLSVKEHCPDAAFFVCVADDPGPDFHAPEHWAGWLAIEDLEIPNVQRFAFQYSPFELSCALKPYAMRRMFQLGFDRVVYLDSDMQVYGHFTHLHRWLDEASLVLTPHAISPVPLVPGYDERAYLRAGVFNAGFVAVRRSPSAEQFLTWWSQRLAQLCRNDQPEHLFVDQKWLDLVPGLFPDTHISRHFGYNAGYWTLKQVAIAADSAGQIHVGQDPLVIWHFSGFQVSQPEIVSRYSVDGNTSTFPALRPIMQRYAQRLLECGADHYQALPCELTRLSDGTPISPAWREAIRTDHAILADVQNPFDVEQTPDLVARFQAASRKASRLTRWQEKESLMNKIVREIIRPFKRLRPSRQANASTASAGSVTPTLTINGQRIEYLAPTRPLAEILPATDMAEITLFSRLIRQHTWAMPEHEMMVLAAIARVKRPQRIFEFGTFTGGSTLVLAANSPAHASVVTLDIGPLPLYGMEYQPGSLCHGTHFASRIKQLIGDSRQLDLSEYRGTMDLVFVDANHTYQYARNDTNIAFDMLRAGGVIVWHDYTWLPEHSECVGVTQAVNEFHHHRGHCYHIAGTRFAIYAPNRL